MIVVTLFGSRQITELIALARPRLSLGTSPIRNESESGEDMFMSAARTTYSAAAIMGPVTNAREIMNMVERP